MVHRLVEMRGDVNSQTGDWFKRTALMRAVYAFKVFQHRFLKVTMLSKNVYHAKDATPLILAVLSGNDECCGFDCCRGKAASAELAGIDCGRSDTEAFRAGIPA